MCKGTVCMDEVVNAALETTESSPGKRVWRTA
jgi:hypothetical protein